MHIQKKKFLKSQKKANSLCPLKNISAENLLQGDKQTQGYVAFNQGEEPFGNCFLVFHLRDGKLSVLRVLQRVQPNMLAEL